MWHGQSLDLMCQELEGFTPSYILHALALRTYLSGGYLPYKKDYKVLYFSK